MMDTSDGYRILEQCVRTVREKTRYPAYELIIVDNQSSDPQTLRYFDELTKSGAARVLRYDAPFNYSAINNFAVREARGELICLLNNDIEVITPEWLDELVSHAVKPGVGAVGAKLLYPDGRLQHAGVLMGLHGVAGHVFRLLGRNQEGYFGRPQVAQAIGGCTGACLLMRKEHFLQVGGLDEERLRVAFNDVDLCLKLLDAGLRNVYTPWAELVHHESVSRGYEDTPEKQARFKGEIEVMLGRWGDKLRSDPAYNPNLSLESFTMELAWPPRARKPWRPA
jgi:GT2 family glycosyltransferase